MKKFSFIIFMILLPMLASAENAIVNGINYGFYPDTKTATVGMKTESGSTVSLYSGDIVIPDKVTYKDEVYTVTSIYDNAFTWASNLTSIVLPNTITSIGKYAFANCSSLTSITFPESLTTIADYAFSDCTSLTSVTIPSSVTSLGREAFRRCKNLTSVTLHCPTVGDYAFYGSTSITKLILGDEVTSLKLWSFRECTGLTSVTIPASVTLIDQEAFSNCTNLTSITLSEGLLKIGSDAFGGCNNLTSITIPSTVTNISAGALWNCSSLTDVYCLPTTVPFGSKYNAESYPKVLLHVPAESVEQYKKKDVCKTFREIVPSTSTNIEFADKAVKAVCDKNWDTDGDGELSFKEALAVTDLGSAFNQNKEITSFKEIRFFRNLTTIDKEAFKDCSGLASMTIPQSVTEIGEGAFIGCSSLASINVESGNAAYDSPDNCNAIIRITDNVLVAGCKNTVIPNSVTAIGNAAFSGASGLTFLSIPNSITSIGDYAFQNCGVFTDVYCYAEEVPKSGADIFDGTNLTAATLFVPNSPYESYKATSPWGNFMKVVDMDSDIEFEAEAVKDLCVANWDTDGNGGLSYREAAAVTNLGTVFYQKEGVTSFNELQYFVGLKSIISKAFNACALTSVIIPKNVTTISYWAFMGCGKLTSVNLPESITYIDSWAFNYCSSIKEVYCYAANVPNTVTDAFSNVPVENITLYVREGSVEAYKTTEPWSKFGKVVVIGSEPEPIIEIQPISEETTVNPSDEAVPGETITTESGVTISLGENDTVDKEDGSVTVTTVMTPDEVRELLKQTKPDEPNFFETFKGMYSLMAASRGYMKIEFETLSDYELTVMLGTDKVAKYTQETRGVIKIWYQFDSDEWVFIFPSVSAAARAKMGRTPVEGGLKIYSVSFVPVEVLPGDANDDGTINAADIVEVVNYIMGSPSEKFNIDGADANTDGTVNAADIVSIVNTIMGQ